jgi:hypothetical protein
MEVGIALYYGSGALGFVCGAMTLVVIMKLASSQLELRGSGALALASLTMTLS